jgi:hypothetical protein
MVDHRQVPGFLLQEQLRVAGNAGGEIRRQGERFVEAVGVQDCV